VGFLSFFGGLASKPILQFDFRGTNPGANCGCYSPGLEVQLPQAALELVVLRLKHDRRARARYGGRHSRRRAPPHEICYTFVHLFAHQFLHVEVVDPPHDVVDGGCAT